MSTSKKATSINHSKVDKQKYVVENTINWKKIAKVIGIFFVSFLVCFFSTKYIFSWLLSQPKRRTPLKTERKITLPTFSLVSSFSQSVKKAVSSLFPKPQYDYYQTKRQFIDPVLVKEALDKKDPNTLIVDIRSAQEYKSAHIKTAISAPAYTNSQDVYGSLTRKSNILTEINKHMKGKRLVVIYGYRPDADVTQDSYEDLKQVIPARVLNVSWNDWKNNFYAWLPNAEKQSFIINTYLEGTDVMNGVGLPHL